MEEKLNRIAVELTKINRNLERLIDLLDGSTDKKRICENGGFHYPGFGSEGEKKESDK